MNDQDYWEQFVKTGNIYDYLNYTACTREDIYGQKIYGSKEGEPISGEDKSDRDGTSDYAYR